MEGMISVSTLIEMFQAKIEFRKHFLEYRNEEEKKVDMIEIKAYEDLICLIKTGDYSKVGDVDG